MAREALEQASRAAEEFAAEVSNARPVRVFYHATEVEQLKRLEAVATKLATEKRLGRTITTALTRVITSKAVAPAQLEVRYYEKGSEPLAEEILKALAAADPELGEARVSFVIPSEYARKNSVDLASQIEVWTSKTSFKP